MTVDVVIAAAAERDIEQIYRYIAATDGIDRADRLLIALHEACRKIADFPQRGNVSKELRRLGMTEFREAHFKPYRIVYLIDGPRVVIYAVLDGRRDMQTLLQQRLTR